MGCGVYCVISGGIFVSVNYITHFAIYSALGISCLSWKSTVMMPRLGVTEHTVYTPHVYMHKGMLACAYIHGSTGFEYIIKIIGIIKILDVVFNISNLICSYIPHI